MTTTTRSNSSRNEGHNGLIASITDVIPLQTASPHPRTVIESSNLHHDELEDDVALEVAFDEEEEKFIDEEISSYDEDGRPVVDTEVLEHRHLTVALVQSCVDQQQQTSKAHLQAVQPRRESSSSNSSPSSPSSDQRRYGLRPRSSVISKSLSSDLAPASVTVAVPGSRKRGRPPSSQSASISNEASNIQQPVTVASPPTTSTTRTVNPQLTTISSLVPNPLISPPNSKPLQPPPSMLLATSQTNSVSTCIPPKSRIVLATSSTAASTSSFSSTVTTPLTSNRTVQLLQPPPPPQTTTSTNVRFDDTNIAQPIPPLLAPTTATVTPKTVAITEPPATVAELPFLVPSQNPPTSRGRIFSIDFDPGFDFSDMALDLVQAPDFGPQQQHQGLAAIPQHKDTNTTANASLQIDLPAVAASEGRNRAFSFEFFSFLDEAPSSSFFDGTTTISASIPIDDDIPDPIMSSSMGGVDDDPRCYDDDLPFHSHRPRGDSIIFDPVSFQDGGIHETNALAKVRSESVASSTLSVGSQAGAMPSAVPSSALTATTGSVESYNKRRAPDVAASITTNDQASSSQQAQTTCVVPTSATSMNANTVTPNVTSSVAIATAAVPSVSSTASPFPMELLNKDGRIGIYLPEARRARIARFHAKRKLRIWRKRIKYDCRKKLADSRPRIKGRFVKRSDLDDEE